MYRLTTGLMNIKKKMVLLELKFLTCCKTQRMNTQNDIVPFPDREVRTHLNVWIETKQAQEKSPSFRKNCTMW